MSDAELRKISIEEFSRLQDYMLSVEKDSAAYKLMKRRYIELKAILSGLNVNVVELDIVRD